jgi:flavin reductase (DIM6/NTAB) family NADH-FMN oxidoreductase RutF
MASLLAQLPGDATQIAETSLTLGGLERGMTFQTINPEVLYFGTPVAVVSTLNPDGSTNLAAMSSFWALGDCFVLGIGSGGQTAENLMRTGECVLNFPSPSEWAHVERLAPTTGKAQLNDYHRDAGIHYEPCKFAVSGFSPLRSEVVAPLRAAECPVQIEARLRARHFGSDDDSLSIFEVRRLRVHADEHILEGEGRVNIGTWSPLFYVFRHYFGKGMRLGKSFRARY